MTNNAPDYEDNLYFEPKPKVEYEIIAIRKIEPENIKITVEIYEDDTYNKK